MKRLSRIAVGAALAASLLAQGCATQPRPGEDPVYRAAQPVPQPPVRAVTGSVYQSGYSMRLFENPVAREVGDILTITLREKTDAKKTAETGVTKDSSGAASAALAASGLAIQPWSVNADAAADREVDGAGESAQSNRLTGNISVVVSDVLPNGNLVVGGEKWITLNQGEEYIRISGIVRPEDIAPNNTVPSLAVADARISYGGTGPIADANQLGWLARFFVSAVFPL